MTDSSTFLVFSGLDSAIMSSSFCKFSGGDSPEML